MPICPEITHDAFLEPERLFAQGRIIGHETGIPLEVADAGIQELDLRSLGHEMSAPRRPLDLSSHGPGEFEQSPEGRRPRPACPAVDVEIKDFPFEFLRRT